MTTEPPIFIVGAGRSGTTLLRSLLSAHSRIAVTPETHFLKNAAAIAGPGRETAADVARFCRSYAATRRFRDTAVDRRRWLALVTEPSFRSAFDALLTAYGEAAGKPRVGEKTPSHVDHLPTLFEWFPEARVIALRRDPRAMVASQLKSPWVSRRIREPSLRDGLFVASRRRHVVRLARRWRTIYEDILPPWEADPRVLVQSYEDLVQDCDGSLRKLCVFLGESYEDAMLTRRDETTVPLAAATEEVRDDTWRTWRKVHHAQTLAPVSPRSLDKWQAELSAGEVAVVEAICAKGMARSGYAPVSSGLKRGAARFGGRSVALLAEAEARLRGLPA